MASRTRFRLKPNWEKEIEKLPKLKDHIGQKAAEASDLARGFSPVRSGFYARSHVSDNESFGNTDPASHLIEFGYGPTPAYHPLARAAEAAGMEFEPEGGTLS